MTLEQVGPGPAPRADLRAARRAFVRAHHPDVGGDPEAFRAGLATFGAPTRASSGGVGPAADDPRLDAPITAVRSVTIHRLGRAGRRLIRRCHAGSARVV